MLQHKVLHSLILFFFVSVVTTTVFFLLNLQVTPLLNEMADNVSAVGASQVAAMLPQPNPTTATVTLDLLLTLPAPTAPNALTPNALTPTTPTPDAATPVAPMGTQTGIVNSDLVNLRSYPSLAGEVVGQARQGDHLTIIAASNDGLWLHVCCPVGTSESNRQSWIATEFMTITSSTKLGASAIVARTTAVTGLAPAKPTNQLQTDGAILTGSVNEALVNLRSGPAITYPTIGQAQEQTIVTINGRDDTGTWWRICCPLDTPNESWISAEFIDLTVARERALVQIPIVPRPAMTSTTVP